MPEISRSDTDLQVDDIKKVNAQTRKSVFTNSEYGNSSASIPVAMNNNNNSTATATSNAKRRKNIKEKNSDDDEFTSDNSISSSGVSNTTKLPTTITPSSATSVTNDGTGAATGSAQVLPHPKLKHRYTRDGKLRARFSDVKFQESHSIFEDEKMVQSDYFGFYILGWITIAIIFFDTAIHFHLAHGSLLNSPIFKILKRDLWKVAFTDLAMYACMYLTFSLQLLVKYNIITWNKTGWILQSFLEFSVLFFYLWFSEYQGFPWVGKVFICLHSLVMLMKVHSYAFYNGYFWKIKDELAVSKQYLSKHDNHEGVAGSSSSDTGTSPLDDETRHLLNESIKFCQFELQPQVNGSVFPDNINVKNFFEYTMFPTVVYEMQYPRTERIRWRYVFSKICGIIGIIFIMIMIAQNQIFPLYYKAMTLRQLTFTDRLLNYPLLLIDLMPPFLALYLFTWYLIWELILNAIAELSRFADRDFYGQWWNCISWDEFARIWNIPVHKFLLRHVYHSSISVLRLSKLNATFFTFLLSSFVHELVMFVIFGKLRGYLLFLQMCQLPLAVLSRSKFFKERKVLGNVIFWLGIASGPSLMCSLYLTF